MKNGKLSLPSGGDGLQHLSQIDYDWLGDLYIFAGCQLKPKPN
jgi:hypothetical protein